MKELQEVLTPHAFAILLLIKAAQNQNGLRHSDYGRYHRYCTRRMLRIRKKLGHTQHRRINKKSIYTPKPITSDLALTNVKFLHILIFKCEADWAYAMQMKQVANNLQSKAQHPNQIQALTGNRSNPNRLRMHYLKRFKAAAKTAKWVVDNCANAFDEQSRFELEAYVDFIEAVYLMEYHKFD